ncbi:hypothetical protein H2200_010451 [Cladophialophora chaetospira]|uniref:Uncharacterized protein n=1 Tax=Cladophialophora chaetospira TaxID=386627 RepID=A0AA39CE86_9EURO|nr:hypothetical protein H2200_010451 [Cladophialophora chaetospira]
MSPSSARTPNFSRPLPSPFETGTPGSPPPAAAQHDGRCDTSIMAHTPGKSYRTMKETPKVSDDKRDTNSLSSLTDNTAESPATIVYNPESQTASLPGNLQHTPASLAETVQDLTASPADNLADSSASPADDLEDPSTSLEDESEDEPTSPPPVAKDAKYTASPAKQKVWQRLFAHSKGREQTSPQDLTLISNDVGNMDQPIMEFRPQLFPSLDPTRPILNLDLFWPIKAEDMDDAEEINSDGDQKGVLPFKELKPLIAFRNLHVLELHGMMRSYQPIIWETCFVNPNLSKLTLEMALEPEFNDDFKNQYKKIDTTWSFDNDRVIYDEPSEYLGSHGIGELHPEFGSGEYLDRNAMKQAQATASNELKVAKIQYLPIVNLTLTNFAVDAGPFFRFFDPACFKEVTFKGTCWDAGFFLPNEMRKTVAVRGPQAPKSEPGMDLSALPASLRAEMAAKGLGLGDLKVVTLSKGKVVKREAWDGKNHLPEPPAPTGGESSVGGGVGGGKSLKGKVNQMLGVGKNAARE